MSLEILIQIFQVTTGLLVLYILGMIILSYINKVVKLPIELRVSVAVLAGLVTIAIQLFLYSSVGIKWNVISVAIPWVILLITSKDAILDTWADSISLLKKANKFNRLSTFEKVLIITGVLLIAGYIVRGITQPIVGWDALAMWLYKAKVYYGNGRIIVPATSLTDSLSVVQVNLQKTIPSTLQESTRHQDYPPLFPLMLNVFYLAIGHINELFARVINLVLITTFVATLYSIFHKKVDRTVLIALCFSFIAFPTIALVFINPVYFGYADFAVGTMMGLSLLFLVYAITSKEPKIVYISVVFGVLAALTKNEGQAFVGIILLLVTLYYTYKLLKKGMTPKQFTKYLLVVFVCAFPLVLWIYFTKKNNLNSEFFTVANIKEHLPLFKVRATQIAKYTYHFITKGSYLILLMLTLFGVGVATILKKKITILVYLILILQVCFYIAVYLVTPAELIWHLQTSFDRLILQLTPGIFVATATVFLQKNKIYGLQKKE